MKVSERLRAEKIHKRTEIEAAVFEVGASLAELLEERLPLPGHEAGGWTMDGVTAPPPCKACGHEYDQHCHSGDSCIMIGCSCLGYVFTPPPDATTVDHQDLSPCVNCGHPADHHVPAGCISDDPDDGGPCLCQAYVYSITMHAKASFPTTDEPICTCGHPVSGHDFLRNRCYHFVDGKRCECLGFLQRKQETEKTPSTDDQHSTLPCIICGHPYLWHYPQDDAPERHGACGDKTCPCGHYSAPIFDDRSLR